jgi:Ribbon-helix-helix protein
MENRTARFTILVDPRKKEVFERLCDLDDLTPSQLIRKFMRDYIESHMGPDWQDQVFGGEQAEAYVESTPITPKVAARKKRKA